MKEKFSKERDLQVRREGGRRTRNQTVVACGLFSSPPPLLSSQSRPQSRKVTDARPTRWRRVSPPQIPEASLYFITHAPGGVVLNACSQARLNWSLGWIRLNTGLKILLEHDRRR